MPPKRRRRFQGLYYHSSPPKVLPMNAQIANSNGRPRRDHDDLSVKLSTIRIWMHEKDIGKLTRVLWAGQGNRLRQQASTNGKVKRFLAAVPHVMNSIKDVHQAVIDNSLENLQANLEPPVPPALVTCRDANGLNLIHKAAGLGHATILEYLITTWPDGVNETDITGKTPLHWAASAKNNMRCYTLLTQAGCDEEAVDYKMKTPSFYRHKPHEIERAFLTYVPEAPRVPPDVATDWDALSDDSGNGKKLDIKIPEMNGFGRHSNADSHENTLEAEMTEADSNREDEDATNKQQDENSTAKVDEDNNVENEDTEEQPDKRDGQEIEEQEEKEIPQEEGEEMQDMQKDNEEEELLDEKQQTQNHYETTENLIKDSDAANTTENEFIESDELESENNDEKDNNKVDEHTTEVESIETIPEEKENAEHNKEISDDIEKTSVSGEQKINIDTLNEKRDEQENNENNDGAFEESTNNYHNQEIVDKTTSVNENDDNNKDIAADANSVKEETGEEKKPEVLDSLEEGKINERSAEILSETTNVSENKKPGNDIIKDSINGEKETDEKEKPDNNTSQEENQEQATGPKVEEIQHEEKEDQSDIKSIGETLIDIKDEIKDNAKYLANKIKNVFTEENEDKKDKDTKEEISDNEKIDSKLENKNEKLEINEEHESDENIKDEEDGYRRENSKEFIETKENDILEQSNGKEKETANNQETEMEGEKIKLETEIEKKASDKQTTATDSNDGTKENSNNSNDTEQSSSANSNKDSSNSNDLTALKTTPNESPKKENKKTDEDENNNNNGITFTETDDASTANITEEITDEQFQEVDKSLEEYKKGEENVVVEKEKDITDKLEEMADNIKENAREMTDKVMNVLTTTSNTKRDSNNLEEKSNDKVMPAEDSKKQTSAKKIKQNSEIGDDTSDEDEETHAENEENNEIQDEVVTENDNEPETELESEHEPSPEAETEPVTNVDKVDTKEINEEKPENDRDDRDDVGSSPSPSLAIEGFIQGDAEDNTVQSQTAAYVHDNEETRLQRIVASGDMEHLAQIVLNGDGQKLLNIEATEPEIQAFLKNVPNNMDKIRRVHEAARNGSLLNLQQALDRRKFAIAKDEISPNGATPLHVAVVFGNSDIVRYLSARFPETTTVADNDGRTALHYAAVINDNGHFYNVLLQLGANSKVVDKMGYTPEDYLGKEELQDTLNYVELLKRFGAEDLEQKLLNDQGHIENQSIQENPLFKTEQGKYLADNLADPLIKALTQVAQKRPNDPLQYLANYLQSYLTSRNTNGRTITQAAVHSGGSQKNAPVSQIQRQTAHMNGHINYDSTDNIEEDSLQQNEQLDGDGDEDNDSDGAMSKKMEERDEHGQSMLHFACARSHRKGGLIHLIEDSKTDITYRDELYRTARDVALQANQFGNAKEIDSYVMSLAIVGDIKPFEHLALSGYDHIIDVLDDNETPIIEVVEARGLHELGTYLRSIRPLEELREELHQMIRDNNVGRVKEIADGPNGKWLIRAKNYYGRTALHIAILKESVEIVEHFVNICPEALKIGDNLERTALHYAMGTNIIESVSRILIQNGAKRTNKDLKGRQPSYYFMNKADILRLQEEEDESR